MSILDSFTSSVNTFFSTVIDSIKAFAYAFLPKATNLIEVGIEEIASIAGMAVLDQATKILDGQTKFSNAVDAVVNEVQSQGKTIAINTAKAAVQLAYLEAQKIAQNKN